MKSIIQISGQRLSLLFICLFAAYAGIAQEGTTTSQTSTSHSTSVTPVTDSAAMWYMNPVVWVIGAVVLLLIIVIAARSGRSNVSNTEVSRTTTTVTTVKED